MNHPRPPAGSKVPPGARANDNVPDVQPPARESHVRPEELAAARMALRRGVLLPRPRAVMFSRAGYDHSWIGIFAISAALLLSTITNPAPSFSTASQDHVPPPAGVVAA